MQTENLFDPLFWEEMWSRAGQKRRKKQRMKSDEGTPWDRRAGHFARKTGGSEGGERTQAVLNYLENEGALGEEIEVLDVGCGPGTLTIPLARKTKRVFALDPSEKMLEMLQERAAAEGIDNIVLLKERWQDVDLAQKGWLEEFDLAFASMSPGIRESKDLQKLIHSSKRHCYVSTFAGRKDSTREAIWLQVVGAPQEAGEMEIFYPFNLLYAWGYRPHLRFFRNRRADWLEPEDIEEEMLQYLHMTVEVDESVKEKVRSYLMERLVEGKYLYEREHFHGMLLWDKNIVFPAANPGNA